jgi:hypothetical protein
LQLAALHKKSSSDHLGAFGRCYGKYLGFARNLKLHVLLLEDRLRQIAGDKANYLPLKNPLEIRIKRSSISWRGDLATAVPPTLQLSAAAFLKKTYCWF